MDAIVTAGGIPLPEEPLYPATQGHPKALVDIAGKPMIQWVLDALTQSTVVENVILVGLSEKSDVKCGKPLYFIPNQGKMLDNLRAGAEKVLEINIKARHVLLVSSDIPAISGEMVDWAVNTAMQTDDDIYYNIIQREVMEKRFPSSKRTYTRLKDMEVCGGDMNVGRVGLLTSEDTDLWEKITNARKSPLKQAGLIGFDTLFLLLFRQLTLEKAAANIMKRLKITGRTIVCPYAEIGMDIDKPHQLEILRADLAKAQRRKNKAVPKKVVVKKAAARKPQKKAK
ncbi:MAG: NTP transferase domain-containing protein [Anaerolineales bacterium]|jgi:GTP:adenosylcobinamide-phosphate guanylyltransferase|nr:NTP transferase domain-containing protein [Anaerolineales bacterium]